MASPQANAEINENLCPTLNTIHEQPVAFMEEPTCEDMAVEISDGSRWIVRRLTPTECERLQGFEDGWTDIGEWTDERGRTRKTSDGNRYKALGNSMAVPVMMWIGKRIAEVDAAMNG